MKEVMVLRDLECIKAVAHPKRIEILNQFENSPLSAKQLSEILEEPHAKINYHIKMLYKVGILDLVEEKIKSGIVEKYYYPTAKSIEIGKNVFNFSLAGKIEGETDEFYVNKFEDVSEAFFNAAEAGKLSGSNIEDFHNIELSKEEAEEIKETLRAKLEEIAARENRDADRERYEVAFVSIPEK